MVWRRADGHVRGTLNLPLDEQNASVNLQNNVPDSPQKVTQDCPAGPSECSAIVRRAKKFDYLVDFVARRKA